MLNHTLAMDNKQSQKRHFGPRFTLGCIISPLFDKECTRGGRKVQERCRIARQRCRLRGLRTRSLHLWFALLPGVQKVCIGLTVGIGQIIFRQTNLDSKLCKKIIFVQSVAQFDQFVLWVGHIVNCSKFSKHVVIIYWTNYILSDKLRFRTKQNFYNLFNQSDNIPIHPMRWPFGLWLQFQ